MKLLSPGTECSIKHAKHAAAHRMQFTSSSISSDHTLKFRLSAYQVMKAAENRILSTYEDHTDEIWDEGLVSAKVIWSAVLIVFPPWWWWTVHSFLFLNHIPQDLFCGLGENNVNVNVFVRHYVTPNKQLVVRLSLFTVIVGSSWKLSTLKVKFYPSTQKSVAWLQSCSFHKGMKTHECSMERQICMHCNI